MIGFDSLGSSTGVGDAADGASDSGAPLAASAKSQSVKLGSGGIVNKPPRAEH
jgi:hypothetical protein